MESLYFRHGWDLVEAQQEHFARPAVNINMLKFLIDPLFV